MQVQLCVMLKVSVNEKKNESICIFKEQNKHHERLVYNVKMTTIANTTDSTT